MDYWNSHGNGYFTVAVLAAAEQGNLKLIRLHGYDVSDKGITFEFDSFNRNPSNDQQFVNYLRKYVEENI